MKNKWIILLAIFTSTIIQNCASTGKITTEKQKSKTETVDKELYAELQALKSIQPIKFGLNVAQVKEQFPTPDKFDYDPMVNKNVTTLARDFGGRRVTFFFYEDKLYKVAIISKWSNYTLKFAEEYIKRTEAILIEGNGEPDLVEENETHKNMVWSWLKKSFKNIKTNTVCFCSFLLLITMARKLSFLFTGSIQPGIFAPSVFLPCRLLGSSSFLLLQPK